MSDGVATIEETERAHLIHAKQNGIEPMALFKNKPRLMSGLDFYFRAYVDELDSERHHGMGYMRIPASKIHEFADRARMDDSRRADLLYFIVGMDRAAQKYYAENRKRDSK